jgi:hypothetical protein
MLKKVIALDESRIFLYNPLSRDQAKFWTKGHEPPKLPRQELHERKRLIVVGMDFNSVALYKLMEENLTMNADRYKEFLEEYVTNWAHDNGIVDPIVLHDNAKPHKVRVVRGLFKEKSWTLLPHASYSPDMNPCDFNCFGPLKQRIRGIRYMDFEELQSAIQ